MRFLPLALAHFFLMAFEFRAIDEIVKELVRAFLAGKDEIVASIRDRLDDAVAGEKIVREIDRTQGLQARAVLLVPAFDGGTLAILLLGAVLPGDELGLERHHLGMARRDNGRRHHGMIALDLTVGALARLAVRANDVLATKIFRSVESHQGSVAQPAETLTQGGREQQIL